MSAHPTVDESAGREHAAEVGQLWFVRKHPAATWTTDDPIRVMAIIEGYVVARFKGCMPFIRTVKGFETEYEFIPDRQKDAKAK